MDEINTVNILLGFCIFINIGWLVLYARTNREWYKQLLELNDSWGNYYKDVIRELINDIANGEDKKDERNNVL